MLLILDNYDSFTWNLVQYFGELGQKAVVYRNDQITLQQIESLQPTAIVISPGPGTPDDAGISMAVIKHFAGKIPILGVCLGHQAIAQVFGGKIIHAKAIVHGKTSKIFHNNQGLFRHLTTPCTATRYHSLVVDKTSLPDTFEITAWTENSRGEIDEIMAIQHKNYPDCPVAGVQFHPESILTEQGHQLLRNFLKGQTEII